MLSHWLDLVSQKQKIRSAIVPIVLLSPFKHLVLCKFVHSLLSTEKSSPAMDPNIMKLLEEDEVLILSTYTLIC